MSGKIKVNFGSGEVKEVDVGSTIAQILGTSKAIGEPLCAIVDGEIAELTRMIHYDINISPITIESPLGERTYMRSATFLLIKAVDDVFPGARVTIEHALDKGLYGEIHYTRDITIEDISLIKQRMCEIVHENIVIEKIKIKKEEATRIFESYGMCDKLRLLRYLDIPYINLYKCGHLYDYFYGTMVPSMGYISLFDLQFYNPGFILLYPHLNDHRSLPEFKDLPKLAKVFKETENWARILDVADVGSLNEKVVSGEIDNLVLVAEGLHEKKIANIADKIYVNKDTIKVVLIAGPSSSGKTTFSKRLSIQLRVLGLRPYAISLDDYFVERDKTPKDEYGNFDFECLGALDTELFNDHLSQLLEGKEIEFPRFNFITGSRENSGLKFKMDDKSILVVEGIHGLNEKLTSSIQKDNKYKIYISALTQLNIDDHNRIPTTDVRLIRRIVRDNTYRGRSAAATILGWQSVRDGEEKNIFPYQEEAETMFNSTLVYEMSVLKKSVEPLLRKIQRGDPAYIESKRLLLFLDFFKETGDSMVPKNSIIREFIGGSCFYDK
jgi:uridine kinase